MQLSPLLSHGFGIKARAAANIDHRLVCNALTSQASDKSLQLVIDGGTVFVAFKIALGNFVVRLDSPIFFGRHGMCQPVKVNYYLTPQGKRRYAEACFR